MIAGRPWLLNKIVESDDEYLARVKKKFGIAAFPVVPIESLIGEEFEVYPYTFLDGTGGLTIGSNCSISAGVQIYTHDSLKWALSGGKFGYDKAPVTIGSNCYLAPYVVVSKGVTIGDCSVVGSHSLVKLPHSAC